MYKNILQSVEGIGIFGTVAMLIFLVVFIVITYMVFTARKSHMDKMAQIPLDDSLSDDNQESE